MNAAQIGSWLAPLNALLNATSAVFLFAGWFAIRAKRVEEHRRRMQGAFIASGVFLISYVARFALTGTHRFPDVGIVRTAYLAILSTHTLLAMAALPLVITTMVLARRGRFEQHKKLARVTFPIWAYVSVTGIVVYLMLYQLAPRLVSAPKPLLDLPAYVLTDQHGKPFGAAELRGKTYIADFVFTTCPSVCPRLTKRMFEIQRRTDDLGDALHLVTFSVDPETDTPERLAAYALKYEANEARWTFLTGQLGEMEAVIVKGFKMALGKTQTSPGIFEIFHGERLVLVDGEGKIRGFYEANDEGIEAVIRDARLVIAR